MKSSFLFRGVSVAAVAGLLAATPGALPAQSTPAVVSAQPGQRGGVTVPAPESRRPAPLAGPGDSHSRWPTTRT